MRDIDKESVIPLAREFVTLGFGIISTSGTAAALEEPAFLFRGFSKFAKAGPRRPRQKRRHRFYHQHAERKIPREDEVTIRNASLAQKIPIMTTIRAAQASVNGIRSLQKIRCA